MDLNLTEVHQRLNEQGVSLSLSQNLKEEIVDRGFNRETGARALRRTVEQMIEDALAEEMLRGNIGPGSTIKAKLSSEGEVVFSKIAGKIKNDTTTPEIKVSPEEKEVSSDKSVASEEVVN